ncbi:ABC transporter permease [Parabacteroides sp. OttesenSCG-928-K15]|nr:ABC transporter permease [Parabacteroides sp. OttesenSCG-928-K15]
MKIILLAIRSLTRFRLYTWVNVLGLALSLACVIIISRYVYSEYTTDRGFENQERICLTVKNIKSGAMEPFFFTSSNLLLRGDYVDHLDIAEVEKHTSFVSLKNEEIRVGNTAFDADIFATDPLFLQVFSYPVRKGNPDGFLQTPTSAVITSDFAFKLFGEEEAVGKNISYNDKILTIEHVIDDIPTHSSFSFDLLVSQKLQWRWPPRDFYSAVLMYPGIDTQKVNKKLKINPEGEERNNYFQVFPLNKVYFDKTINKGTHTIKQGNQDNMQVLILIAVLILLMGIFNFIHLYAVILRKRDREMGMKTVFGARSWQLFSQIYMENFALTLFAVIIGWALTEITAGLQVSFLHIYIVNNRLFNTALSLFILFGVPLINTLYPYLRHKAGPPVVLLKGEVKTKRKIQSQSFFLIAQYGITMSVAVMALFFMKQLDAMLHKDPGYRTKDVIRASFVRPSSTLVIEDEGFVLQERVGQAIEKSPLFTDYYYGLSPYELTEDQFNFVKARVEGDEEKELCAKTVGERFFDFFEIQVSPHWFPMTEKDALLNRTASQLMYGNSNGEGQMEVNWSFENSMQIKGVIPDIQTGHLSQHHTPLLLSIGDKYITYGGKLNAAIAAGKRREAIEYLRKLHAETIGGDFSYSFMEDEIREIYRKDRQVANIYSTFALIAILISSMGLFSLSLFDIQRRYKEIAIRKVNGATSPVIIKLIVGKYLKLLVIAFLIAIPLSWLAITRYLENFAYKTAVSWWIFAVAFLITAGIALLTLVWQTRKAAMTNPAIAIKTE